MKGRCLLPAVLAGVLIWLAGMTGPAEALTLELKKGERLQGAWTLQDGRLVLPDGRAFAATEARQLLFGAGTEAGAATAVAGQDAKEILSLAASAKAFQATYPDAGGVVLLDDMDYVYRADGSNTLVTHFIGLVLKEDHLKWATAAAAYTEGRQRVRILLARSIHPDGTVFAADPAQTQLTKPQTSPGMFLAYHIASLRVPQAKVGCVIEIKIEHETYNPFHPEFFFPSSYFQTEAPTLRSRLKVELPSERKLFWNARQMPKEYAEPARTEKDGRTTYTWDWPNIPPMIPEPLMPRAADGIPYVHCSLFEGWEKIYDWINVYWKKNTTPSPELASQTARIIEGAKNDDEKVARILHWIERNIRYIIIKGDAATIYGSYPAHETVAKQFGCCVDKAMVFSAMLNAAGVPNGPLLINAGSHDLSARVPTLEITHSISRVTRQDGRKYYLDSTGYDFRYPFFPTVDQGRHCIDPFDRSFDFIPVPPPEDNLVRLVSTMTLDLDGALTVETRKEYTGEFEVGSRAYWKSVKPAEREKNLQARINDYSKGAELTVATFTNLEAIELPFWYRYEYRLPAYPQEIADLVILPLPSFMESYLFDEAALASRTYDIEYDSSMSMVDEGVLNLPANLQVRTLPEPLKVETPWFTFEGGFRAAGPGTVAFHAAMARKVKRIAVADYPAFKAGLDRIQNYRRQRIFLTREQKGGRP